MTDKYIAPYIPFAVVNPQTGMATAQFQAFWKNGLEGAVTAAESAAAAQAAAEAAQATADTKQPESLSLTSIAGLSSMGLVEQIGPDVFTNRDIGVATATSIPARSDADGRYVQRNQTAAPVYSAYGGQTMGAAYSQAQAQATDDALKALSAAVVSLNSKLQAIHAFT